MNGKLQLQVLDWSKLDADGRRSALQRPLRDMGSLRRQVADILDRVREDGDAALRAFSEQFDSVQLDEIEVDEIELQTAAREVSPELLEAMRNAAGRIRAFHAASAPIGVRLETCEGLTCESLYRPISPVGLYVPGGSAPLISTVLMLAVPASLAGCGEVVLCSPPSEDGSIHPAILAAAELSGVRRVFRAGGAHAIAAMAFGTESIPACAKLFGPGNAWVTEAKQQVANLPGGAALDIPAGPSEVLVIADGDADPEAVAWDLLSQAEHGPDSQALCLSDSARLLGDIAALLPRLAGTVSRTEILTASLANTRLIVLPSVAAALELSNDYAPEHLILNCARAEELLDGVTAAGSVFLGPWTPESLGDYCSGTNHVLPTYGYARAYSGLSVADFLRRMTVQRAAPQGIVMAGPDAMVLAEAEGLDAHRMAVEYRLACLERQP